MGNTVAVLSGGFRAFRWVRCRGSEPSKPYGMSFLRPQGADLAGQRELDVVDFSGGHVLGDHVKDSAGDFFSGDARTVRHGGRDVGQELFLLAFLDRLTGRMPALVVEAADQHR